MVKGVFRAVDGKFGEEFVVHGDFVGASWWVFGLWVGYLVDLVDRGLDGVRSDGRKGTRLG